MGLAAAQQRVCRAGPVYPGSDPAGPRRRQGLTLLATGPDAACDDASDAQVHDGRVVPLLPRRDPRPHAGPSPLLATALCLFLSSPRPSVSYSPRHGPLSLPLLALPHGRCLRSSPACRLRQAASESIRQARPRRVYPASPAQASLSGKPGPGESIRQARPRRVYPASPAQASLSPLSRFRARAFAAMRPDFCPLVPLG